MATTPVGATSGSTNLAQSIAGNQKLGQDEFLKLLVTQLTNQDPLSPQDDKEFLAQMAQFSTVEGIKDLDTSMNRGQAASFINRNVQADIIENGSTTTVTGSVKAVTYQQDGAHLLVTTSNGDRDIPIANLTMVSN